MAINAAQLISKMNEKGARGQCPICGHNNWGADDDTGILLQAWDGSGNLNIGQGAPALAMVCANCGFIRLHSIPALEQG
jgi:predicted RNA-binding Zn-ribbon protein involved in translation (DUF1610 family)